MPKKIYSFRPFWNTLAKLLPLPTKSINSVCSFRFRKGVVKS